MNIDELLIKYNNKQISQDECFNKLYTFLKNRKNNIPFQDMLNNIKIIYNIGSKEIALKNLKYLYLFVQKNKGQIKYLDDTNSGSYFACGKRTIYIEHHADMQTYFHELGHVIHWIDSKEKVPEEIFKLEEKLSSQSQLDKYYVLYNNLFNLKLYNVLNHVSENNLDNFPILTLAFDLISGLSNDSPNSNGFCINYSIFHPFDYYCPFSEPLDSMALYKELYANYNCLRIFNSKIPKEYVEVFGDEIFKIVISDYEHLSHKDINLKEYISDKSLFDDKNFKINYSYYELESEVDDKVNDLYQEVYLDLLKITNEENIISILEQILTGKSEIEDYLTKKISKQDLFLLYKYLIISLNKEYYSNSENVRKIEEVDYYKSLMNITRHNDHSFSESKRYFLLLLKYINLSVKYEDTVSKTDYKVHENITKYNAGELLHYTKTILIDLTSDDEPISESEREEMIKLYYYFLEDGYNVRKQNDMLIDIDPEKFSEIYTIENFHSDTKLFRIGPQKGRHMLYKKTKKIESCIEYTDLLGTDYLVNSTCNNLITLKKTSDYIYDLYNNGNIKIGDIELIMFTKNKLGASMSRNSKENNGIFVFNADEDFDNIKNILYQRFKINKTK